MNVLYFSRSWPRIDTIAGSRCIGILESLLKDRGRVIFVSSAKKSKQQMHDLKQILQVQTQSVNPTDEFEVNKMFKNIPIKPEVAIFEDFHSEEAFSSSIYKRYARCLRVLSLNQVQSLSTQRQEHFENSKEFNLATLSRPFENTDTSKRELASMYRSDLVLFSSDYEQMKGINEHKLTNTGLMPLFYDDKVIESPPLHNYLRKKNFLWIGNCNDPASLDSVQWVINDIWPIILKSMPDAKLDLYGQNFPQEIQELQSDSIRCMGETDDWRILSRYRVTLAPFRFGAGIKKQISDSWVVNTPVVTTPVGAEGMFNETFDNNIEYVKLNSGARFYSDEADFTGVEPENPHLISYYNYSQGSFQEELKNLKFGGLSDNFSSIDIANSAIELYNNKDLWHECQDKGKQTLIDRFAFSKNQVLLMKQLTMSLTGLQNIRKKNTFQSILWNETLKADKFSKYIPK